MKHNLLVFLSILLLCLVGCSACSNDVAEEHSLPQWSEALEYEIKKAYAEKSALGSFDEATFRAETIYMTYYGSYSGYEAVWDPGLSSITNTPVEVGGHVFLFGGSHHIILLYRDGTFLGFDTAFREGKITQEDIDRLYETYQKINGKVPEDHHP